MTTDSQGGRDFIDHKSLADYFSTPDREKVVSDVMSAYSYPFNGQKVTSDSKLINQSKSIANERLVMADVAMVNSRLKYLFKEKYFCASPLLFRF